MRLTLSKLAGALSPLRILLACASGGTTGQASNVITAPALAGSQAGSTYQAIRRIRPEFSAPGTTAQRFIQRGQQVALGRDCDLVLQ